MTLVTSNDGLENGQPVFGEVVRRDVLLPNTGNKFVDASKIAGVEQRHGFGSSVSATLLRRISILLGSGIAMLPNVGNPQESITLRCCTPTAKVRSKIYHEHMCCCTTVPSHYRWLRRLWSCWKQSYPKGKKNRLKRQSQKAKRNAPIKLRHENW